MGQEFWKLDTGRRYHIYDGNVRHDLGYPAMVMRCGLTVDEISSSRHFGTPDARWICERCQGGPAPWRIADEEAT